MTTGGIDPDRAAPFFRRRSDPLPADQQADADLAWNAYCQLDRTQWLEPEQIVAHQLAHVRAVVEWAVGHVPYYRRVLGADAFRPGDIQTLDELRRLPILSRRQYQEDPESMCADRLPPGTRALGKLSTSGTSGMPVHVPQTSVTQLMWLVCMMRDLEWCGMDPTESIAVIRATRAKGDVLEQARRGVRLANWNARLAQIVDCAASYCMDVHQPPAQQLEWLRRIGPRYILSYPSNLECLATVAAEQQVRLPGLRAVQAISETLSDAARAAIESAFGVPVRNTYSSCEAGYMASPCPEGHGLHVHAENVLVEVLDDAGRPCRVGEPGRVVLTTFHNFRSPFIRYEIHDEAVPGAARCPCGRGLPLLERVGGKRRPMFRLAQGRLKCSSELASALRQLGGFYQFQITQHAIDRVTARFVPDRDWTPDHCGRAAQAIRQFWEADVAVNVETLDRIPLTSAGKRVDFVVAVDVPPDS